MIITYLKNRGAKGSEIMKDYETFLKKAIELKDKYNSVNFMSIEQSEREVIKKLKSLGLINNVRYIPTNNVGFDITYDGVHYFDD